jgi:hypothetical protein
MWSVYCHVSFISNIAIGGFIWPGIFILRLSDQHGSLQSAFRNFTRGLRVIFKASYSVSDKNIYVEFKLIIYNKWHYTPALRKYI